MIRRWIQQIKEAFRDFKNEMGKVTFPNREETLGSTTVVVVLTLLISVFLTVVDIILVRLLGFVI